VVEVSQHESLSVYDKSFGERCAFNALVLEYLRVDTFKTWDDFYRKHTGLSCTSFNAWHNKNWPQSSIAACVGENWLILFKIKIIHWREKGLL